MCHKINADIFNGYKPEYEIASAHGNSGIKRIMAIMHIEYSIIKYKVFINSEEIGCYDSVYAAITAYNEID